MSAARKISEHREDLEDLAESGLPCEWIARALLDVAEEA